ncbi:hypothetical protein NLU13_0238 [Sarocladium strictum]|uniref:N-glycosylation protein EOS1 n=1 Tax=Sarocladium strictum TaxID=5046 RepID=A0AA39GNP5_SARSR|nr:hypothetical protein NLU13_0238 [Sarocladium strictum]
MTRPPTHNRALSTPTKAITTTDSLPPKPLPVSSNPSNGNTPTPKPTLLQPRLAVVLNVPRSWHPWLFALRLSSILPAVWWGVPTALRLLLGILPTTEGGKGLERYVITETALATIWCFASGYLSFFFTDCLMSRWLINYTPQATIVRLLSINAVNAYVTSTVLTLAGGFKDPRLLLPGWIGIATTLTVCYHITHQKINIRKETSTSVNVFSIASFISMVTLLAHMHMYQIGYPEMPIITFGRRICTEIVKLAAQAQAQNAMVEDREL